MEPIFRDGDIIIVSPGAGIRRGTRVVVRTRDGEVMAKELADGAPTGSSSYRSIASTRTVSWM